MLIMQRATDSQPGLVRINALAAWRFIYS